MTLLLNASSTSQRAGLADARLTQYARSLEHNCSLWQACVECVNQALLSSRAANAILAFLKLGNDMQQDCSGLELHQKVAHVIEHSGLVTMRRRGRAARPY